MCMVQREAEEIVKYVVRGICALSCREGAAMCMHVCVPTLGNQRKCCARSVITSKYENRMQCELSMRTGCS